MTSLEYLLAKPLASIADNGFTKQLIDKIEINYRFRLTIFAGLYAFIAIASLIFLPVKTWLTHFVYLVTATVEKLSATILASANASGSAKTINIDEVNMLLTQPGAIMVIITCVFMAVILKQTD